MPVTDISQLATMTAPVIIAVAKARGYRLYVTPLGDQRIGSKPGTQERDDWKEAANNRLFQIQQSIKGEQS